MTTEEYISKLEAANKELVAEMQDALAILTDAIVVVNGCKDFIDPAVYDLNLKGLTAQCERAAKAIGNARVLQRPPVWLDTKDAPRNTDIMALVGTEELGPFKIEIIDYRFNGEWVDNQKYVYGRNSKYKLYGWCPLPKFPNE